MFKKRGRFLSSTLLIQVLLQVWQTVLMVFSRSSVIVSGSFPS